MDWRKKLAENIIINRAPRKRNNFIGKIAQKRAEENYRLASFFVTGKKILDIGAGYGNGYNFLLAQNPREITCLDQHGDSLNNFLFKDERISFLKQDFLKNTLQDKSYDVVLCLGTIFYIKNHNFLLTEIRQILRDDGVLILNCLNADLIRAYFGFNLEEINEKFSRIYNREELLTLVKRHFSGVVEEYVQLPIRTNPRLIYLFSLLLAPFMALFKTPKVVLRKNGFEGIYNYLIIFKHN